MNTNSKMGDPLNPRDESAMEAILNDEIEAILNNETKRDELNTEINESDNTDTPLTKEKILDYIKRQALNAAIIAYNSTLAEITPIDHNGKYKMPRIPILDTIYRKFYYSYLDGDWKKSLFDESTAEERSYKPLLKSPNGGRRKSSRKNPKKKTRRNRRKSVRRR